MSKFRVIEVEVIATVSLDVSGRLQRGSSGSGSADMTDTNVCLSSCCSRCWRSASTQRSGSAKLFDGLPLRPRGAFHQGRDITPDQVIGLGVQTTLKASVPPWLCHSGET